jgi:hypothetical protein
MKSKYANLADRLGSIQKELNDAKNQTNEATEPEFPENENLLPILSHSINSVISFNTRKEFVNRELNVLDEKLGFPNYINTLNSFRNPDILTGDQRKYLAGNKYRAMMVGGEDDINNQLERQNDKLVLQNEKLDDKKDDTENSDSDVSVGPKGLSRYYSEESKTIRCRNCKEIGHMMRN